MARDEEDLENESIILENSVIDVLSASDLLVELVAKFINQGKRVDLKDEDIRYKLQKAYTLLTRGKKGLKEIGFIQEVH